MTVTKTVSFPEDLFQALTKIVKEQPGTKFSTLVSDLTRTSLEAIDNKKQPEQPASKTG